MILGIGVDLAKVSRFDKLVNNEGFLNKYFHTEEIESIKKKGASASQSLAGRFAAREAFFKAIGTGFNGYNLKDIAVLNNKEGKPEIIPSDIVIKKLDNMGDNWRIHLSISHEKEYAVAQVIVEA